MRKKPRRLVFAERLCKIMAWKDPWKIWCQPLRIKDYEKLIKKLEAKDGRPNPPEAGREMMLNNINLVCTVVWIGLACF